LQGFDAIWRKGSGPAWVEACVFGEAESFAGPVGGLGGVAVFGEELGETGGVLDAVGVGGGGGFEGSGDLRDPEVGRILAEGASGFDDGGSPGEVGSGDELAGGEGVGEGEGVGSGFEGLLGVAAVVEPGGDLELESGSGFAGEEVCGLVGGGELEGGEGFDGGLEATFVELAEEFGTGGGFGADADFAEALGDELLGFGVGRARA
jgi:hypothetical protein